MSEVLPEKGRSKISESGSYIEIVIPAKRNWSTILFLAAWLGAWFIGEKLAIQDLFFSKSPHGQSGFLLFWLIGWTVGGGTVIYSLLQMLFGDEIIVLTSSTLNIKRKCLGVGPSKEYDLHHITNLRLTLEPVTKTANRGTFSLGSSNGSISFDYGARTYRFGNEIDEAEASQIIEKLKSRYYFKEK